MSNTQENIWTNCCNWRKGSLQLKHIFFSIRIQYLCVSIRIKFWTRGHHCIDSFHMILYFDYSIVHKFNKVLGPPIGAQYCCIGLIMCVSVYQIAADNVEKAMTSRAFYCAFFNFWIFCWIANEVKSQVKCEFPSFRAH